MVKELDVQGQNIEEALSSIRSRINYPFRLLTFRHDYHKGREEEALDHLSSFPDFDERSILILNATGGRDFVGVDALIVPKDCPDILPTKEDELYLAEGWVRHQPDRREVIPLVVESASGARQIAERRFSDIFGVHRWQVEACIRQVSKEEMKEFARDQLEQGRSLPRFAQHILEEF